MENHQSNKAKEKRKRGLWSPEEDKKLYNYITTFGVDSWSSLPQNAGLLRCGKSCRLRWINHLDPNLKKCPISPEEESLIISLHNIFGNSWSKIAQSLPGRTDNEVKNFWHCQMKKKFRELGVNSSSEESSSSSTSTEDTLKNEMQTHEINEKLKATTPCYNHTAISSTSEISCANNGQELKTENATVNSSNQWSQITAEEMDGGMSLRDYTDFLLTLINQDEFGNNLNDDNLDAVLYY